MMSHVLKKIICLFIVFYQNSISPLFPNTCRYTPTCSQYMKEAIKKYGLKMGLLIGLKRLGRCHPWGKSGYDPLP